MVNNQKSIFVTFGAGRSGWIGAAKRITAEAERTGLFEFCFNLNESWLKSWDPDIYNIGLNLRKSLPPRGFGYWTWKPSVLFWAHLNFPNHQIIYADAGSEFQFQEEALESLIDLFQFINLHGAVAFSLPGHFERNWTKRDVQIVLKASEDQLNSIQIQSGFLGFSPDAVRHKLISNWRYFASLQNGFYFTDETHMSNELEFIEHRHDQSVLSCLWKIFSLPVIQDPTIPKSLSSFGIISYRNNSSRRADSNILIQKSTKFLNLLKDKILSHLRHF